MNKETTMLMNEQNFKRYMSGVEDVEELDSLVESLPNSVAIADYFIKDLLVIELKTLKVDPGLKLNKYYKDIIKKKGISETSDQLSLRKIANVMPDGEKIIRDIENKIFRNIETIIKKANKQIGSTIANLGMNNDTYGVLVIINEYAQFLEPIALVDFIKRKLSSKVGGVFRFSNINQVVLFQNTHKLTGIPESSTLIPIYGIINGNIKTTHMDNKATNRLEQLIEGYTNSIGCNHINLDSFNSFLDIEKLDGQSDENLTEHERIESHYRHHRYLETLENNELISLHEKMISILSEVLSDKDINIEREKEQMVHIRKFVEVLEEMRLRGFNVKKL